MITPEAPTVTAALERLSNRLRKLELRAGPLPIPAAAGPWQSVTPEAGYTGTIFCRTEGAATVFAGQLTGTFTTGTPTIIKVPSGWRAAYPSGVTYYMLRLVAANLGNAGYITVRIWADGAVQFTAVSGTVTVVDLAGLRFSSSG